MTDFLMDTETLAACLDDEAIRIFDCTTLLLPDPNGTYRVESGKAAFEEAHIPGAAFLDLQGDFSTQQSRLRFTLPTDEDFSRSATAHGISNDSHLVFYSTTAPMWATRLWWMFRTFGHERVSVLDGGLAKWQREDRLVASGSSSGYEVNSDSSYVARKQAQRIADKGNVLEAIDAVSSCIINSLSREQYRGEGMHYGRPGRIKDSESLPWNELVDRESGCFHETEILRNKLGETRALDADRVITYCGGGIAASVTLFALALLGFEDKVGLYDNSLSEWANDPALPMQKG